MHDPWPIADHPVVAWRHQTPVSQDTLRADLAQAQAALSSLGMPRVALFDSDTYRFAVWLIAGWRAGLTMVIPGDALPATRAALTVPWVGDTPEAALSDWCDAAPALTASTHERTAAAEIFTSGSTGAPSATHKTIAQLRNETDALEAAFGSTIDKNACVASSVPHQHLYGLLFRVLWPLAAGRPFMTAVLPWPESLWALPASSSHVLVTSPAMLKRIPALPARPPLTDRFDAIFSSGGPLPADANLACRELLGHKVTEVYGSSETGGIAYRDHPHDAWAAMPGVALKIDAESTLWLRSPFLANEEWMATNDRASLSNGSLSLLGRADRIAKIEEKRVSLTRIEQLLGELPEIRAARVLVLNKQRDEIGAVVVLGEAGLALLRERGKHGLDRHLRKTLEGQLERIALPRRWRFAAELPHNDMGKTTQAMLAALFAANPAQPELLHARHDAEQSCHTLQLYINSELVHFHGHFDAAPVLPGVVQVDWAILYGHQLFGPLGSFAGMRQLKFQRIIQPGTIVTLQLNWDGSKRQLAFAYTSATGTHSSGRIAFTEITV